MFSLQQRHKTNIHVSSMYSHNGECASFLKNNGDGGAILKYSVNALHLVIAGRPTIATSMHLETLRKVVGLVKVHDFF